jgi:hypothetical protein
MEYAKELLKRAAICRRAAAVPTSGSASDDRVLIELAEALEREAASIERQYLGDKPKPRPKRSPPPE